jgi:hypothetical protein
MNSGDIQSCIAMNKVIITTLERHRHSLKLQISTAYELSIPGDVNGLDAFLTLNALKTEFRKLKALIKKYANAQKLLKKGLKDDVFG